MDEDATPKAKKTPQHKRLLVRGVIVLILLCIATTASSVFFYKKYQAANGKAGGHQEELVAKLGATIQLPAEIPTMVTVADKQKLTNQILASRVENNDTLLIFNQAKKLIIYRPSNQKVIDMLTFTDSSEVPTR